MADRKRRILVVEDDPNIRLLIKIALSQDELEVYEASNGAEALDFIKRQTVDLVISDVAMPIMDGHELVLTLKGLPDTSRIPVLMLTAGDSKGMPRDKPICSPDDYLQKPFSVGELLQRVDNLLSSK